MTFAVSKKRGLLMRKRVSVDPAKGVLDQFYSKNRIMRNELKFRLKTRAQMVADVVKEHFHTSTQLKVLDFGAAEGKTILEMKKSLHDSDFTGIELSTDLLSMAGQLPNKVRLFQGDACCLPPIVEHNSYEIVTALACLEHLSNPLKAAKEAVRVLKPGGLFIATCPVPFWDKAACTLKLLKSEQHENELGWEELIKLVNAAGMDLVKYKRFMWAPISVLPYLGMNISVKRALRLDKFMGKLRIFNWLFVNQCIVAQKK